MTREEWDRSNDPRSMFPIIKNLSARKLRLWACAFTRWQYRNSRNKDVFRAVEAAEQWADGREPDKKSLFKNYDVCAPTAWQAAENIVEDIQTRDDGQEKREAKTVQSEMFRCIFGNPFQRMPALDAAIITWNSGAVRKLALDIYERRLPTGFLDRDRMKTLADYLETAGCSSESLLQHCRENDLHIRGCWGLDLALGKR